MPWSANLHPAPKGNRRKYTTDAGAIYYVFASGKVWSCRSGKFLKPRYNAKGYQTLNIDGPNKTVLLSRLMLTLFRRKPKLNEQARHLDGNTYNTCLNNLSWGSAIENAADRKRHNTENYGELNGNSILSEKKADEIRKLWRTNQSQFTSKTKFCQYYAVRYKVSQFCIDNVLRNRAWNHTAGLPKVTSFSVPFEINEGLAKLKRQLGLRNKTEVILYCCQKVLDAAGLLKKATIQTNRDKS